VVLAALSLPAGVELVRTTAELTRDTVPAGLLREHRLATGVWGRLRVIDGTVTFVLEASGESRLVGAGEVQVIEPEVAHHVEPGPGSVFVVELYR
jgi:tellurite resistance-related uncharacterized protein